MTVPRDMLVYEAENVLRTLSRSTRFHSIGEAQEWVDMVQYDRHLLKKYPIIDKHHITLRKSNRYEWAGAHVDYGTIACPIWSLNDVVLGHELAHFASAKEIAKEDHGPIYCGAYIYILGRFVDKEAARSLKFAYQAYGVDYIL